ncbi:hypothetical protein [Noviherbaspirillum sp.]|uniref:hypothetical protein n=1 Tax=Noviherbaspirillum sp. TaxID=1926288 RepID=UPI002D411C0E|nr:hypothetical protein [Noviherbaspirillum sp.]HZW22419.1 hypothetical protein [Noviherbaspirillum sp.]
MAKPKISAWCRRQTSNGINKADARMALKRYQLACEAAVQPFLDAPTEETKRAAIDAINEFISMYQRWVEPYLGEVLAQGQGSTPASTAAEALGQLFAAPSELTKGWAVNALEGHLMVSTATSG